MLTRCFDLELEWPPRALVLKAWSPECGAIGRGRTIRRWSLMKGSYGIGSVPLRGILELSAPSLSLLLPNCHEVNSPLYQVLLP
jgi:hypothetical protein